MWIRFQVSPVSRWKILFPVLLAFLAFSVPSAFPGEPFRLTIAHVNDTHSHLDPTAQTVRIGGTDTGVFLGGFPRLASALGELRSEGGNFLFLHAGDAVQGTLYFSAYQGKADIRFLNLLGVDAMTLGNHEFDKGPDVLVRMMEEAEFPVLSANVRFPKGSPLSKRVIPYEIKRYGSESVAIVGLTTPGTPVLSKPGPSITFQAVAPALRRAVRELETEGIDKIVVLSHIGYDQDVQLAREVCGIDVIVGGHSHTLLGGEAIHDLGLKVSGRYPTAVDGPDGGKVLIVQAWKWGMVLGILDVEFNGKGEMTGHRARPLFVAGPEFIRKRKPVERDSDEHRAIVRTMRELGIFGFYPEEENAKRFLAPYAKGLEEVRNAEIAVAAGDLRIGLNTGPGPLIADGMVWKTGSRIAFQNRGGVRADLREGRITMGDVMEVLPFENRIVLLDMTGGEIRRTLEEGIGFQLSTRPSDPRFPYVSGMRYQLNLAAPAGRRVAGIFLEEPDGKTAPIGEETVYRVAVSDFLANGGDGHRTFRTMMRFRCDAGFIDTEVFAEYLRRRGRVFEEKRPRIALLDAGALQRSSIEGRAGRPRPFLASPVECWFRTA